MRRQEFGYGRDRAAATLAVLAKEPSVRAYLQPLALQPLKAMLQQGDRYEQRDASIALLGLLYNEVRQLRVGQRRTVALVGNVGARLHFGVK